MQTIDYTVILSEKTGADQSTAFMVTDTDSPATIIMHSTIGLTSGEEATLQVWNGTGWIDSVGDILTNGDNTTSISRLGRFRMDKPLTTNATGFTVGHHRSQEGVIG